MSALAVCTDAAADALCLRSRCGAVVMATSIGEILGIGRNDPPDGCGLITCAKDALPEGFRSDKTCCVHAEQNAILDALARNPRAMATEHTRMYFLRLDADGQPKASGAPYCTICSKLTQAAGIDEFALLRAGDVIEIWSAEDYNRLSFAHAD